MLSVNNQDLNLVNDISKKKQATNDNSSVDSTDLDASTDKVNILTGELEAGKSTEIVNSTNLNLDEASIQEEMEASFVEAFASGSLDEYDPRAIMAAAEFVKIQFEEENERKELFAKNLASIGIAGLDQEVAGDIAMQAVEILDAFELEEEDSSENMRSDLVDILLLDDEFDSEENKSLSKIDFDALNTVFNLTDMEQDFVQVYTISAYTTSSYQTDDSLTVSEMLADFSGQESEHDSWAHDRETNTGGYSASDWHNGTTSNDAQLISLKEKMQEASPELLDLTFDNGEAYIFGEKEDGTIVLLATADNEQLGHIGENHQNGSHLSTHGKYDSDEAYNKDFKFDASGMRVTGRAGYDGNNLNNAQEFEGTSDIQIGDKSYSDIDTISINRYNTPLILDLDGDGFDLSSQQDGVHFDLTGDGLADKTAWTESQNSFDDAFLVLDSNNNGQIDSGKELFGDQNGAANGFEELAKHDSNGDGVINAVDEVFEELKLWADMDADGEVDEGEMKGLAEMGITSLDTNFTGEQGDIQDEHGNDLSMQGSFTRNVNGEETAGNMTDVLFVNRDIKKDEVQNLDDVSAFLENKMGSYAEVMGFHNKTVKAMAVEDEPNIRLSLQDASKEVQKIVLANDLADIEAELADLNSQLAQVDAGSSTTNNTAQSTDSTTPVVVNTARTNETANQQGSTNKTTNINSSDSGAIQGRISDLENEYAAVQSRLAGL